MTTVYKHSDLFYVKYRPVLAIFFLMGHEGKKKNGSWGKKVWETLDFLRIADISTIYV